MKKKLEELKDFMLNLRFENLSISQYQYRTSDKIEELMEGEKYRKIGTLFIGSVFGFVLSCLIFNR